MTIHRRFIPLASLLCLSITSSSCNDCYTSGTSVSQTCQQSGAFIVNVAPVFAVTCAPKFDWTGINGHSLLSIQNSCSTDDSFWVNVSFPRGVSEASYTVPSPEVYISASFSPSVPPARNDPNPRPTFGTSQSSLAVSSGIVVVHSSINYSANQESYGIDADMDIHFRTSSGAEFSIVGHAVESACVLHTTPYCQGD
jgi:hypothetical protein